MADNGQKDGELDAETRRGLRILADSTKAKGSEGAARRLYKAADTGSATDYMQAEALFDALPPEKRSSIRATAETTATTMRETQIRRAKAAAAKSAEKPAAPAEFIDWKMPAPESTDGIFQNRAPAQAKAPAKPQQKAENSGKTWDLQSMPGNQRPARSAEKDEEGQNWDWKKLPEDAVTRSNKKEKPKNELDALREEMLRTLKD